MTDETKDVRNLEDMSPEEEIELACEGCGEDYILTKAEIINGADTDYCPQCVADLAENEDKELSDADDDDDLNDDDDDLDDAADDESDED
jgi:hypothetical protein